MRILATRPTRQNAEWCELLREAGFEALAIPMLAIEAEKDAERTARIRQQILSFDLYQYVIFVSQNAVEHCCRWLEDCWPQLPVKISYFAVGKKTASLVEQLLGAASVGGGKLAENTEAMLLLPELESVSGEKILICRGRGGRTKLGDALLARGAKLEYCELYLRVLPREACSSLARVEIDANTDVLTVFSGETLENTLQAAKACGKHDELLAMPIVVPGERVAQLAEERGFKQLYCARSASQECMLRCLQQQVSTTKNNERKSGRQ